MCIFSFKTLRKLLFQIIYKIYLWSSRGNTEFGILERIVEYPFVIRNLMEDLPPPRRVLVVGCAGDPLTTILCALGYKTWGLDIKFVPIKYPSFEFVQGDIRRTTFPDGFFDAIVAVSTIEHVGIFDGDRHGDVNAIKEMARVSVKGGIMLLTVPYGKEGTVDGFQRAYDEGAVKNLLRELTIEKFEVFEQDSEGYWAEAPTACCRSNRDCVRAAALLKVKLP